MTRVKEHPVLGTLDESNRVTIFFEGKPIVALQGETIASALMNIGIKAFRITHKEHQYRGIFCGIGRCTDCVMIVNGKPNVRTCITKVSEGMKIERQIGLGKWGENSFE